MLNTTESVAVRDPELSTSTGDSVALGSVEKAVVPKPSGRLRKWLKRLLLTGVGCGIVAAIGVAWALHAMGETDKQHARFLECGKGVNAFLKEYSSALHAGNVDALSRFYLTAYQSPGRGQWTLVPEDKSGDARLATLVSVGSEDFDVTALTGELESYIADLQSIDRVKCKINLIEEIVPDDHVTLTVKYILDGIDQSGNVLQDRFFFRWHLVSDGKSKTGTTWKIASDQLVEGVRVSGSANGFERAELDSIGIDFTHARDPKLDPEKTKLKFAVIQHAAGGVTAVDYDRDGATDLFFPDGVHSKLFRNTSPSGSQYSLGFSDVTTEVGLGDLDQATCGLFVDVNGDQHLDLFVCRYFAPCRLFINDGKGHFEDRASEYGVDYVGPVMSACVVDFNRDNKLDLFLGVNGNAYEQAPDIPFYATNAEPNVLFRNDGQTFTDVSEKAGVANTGWTLAVAAQDVTGDGYPDLLVANDFGRKELLVNQQDGTFVEKAKQTGVLDFSGGMGIVAGDILNDDGNVDIYTSNINSNQRWFGEEQTIWQYNRNLVRTKWLFDDFDNYCELYNLLGDDWKGLGQQIGEGNSLFSNKGDGSFDELKECHATRAGWAWGIGMFDMENDTDLDLYVCNGWISGKKKDDL